MRKRLMTFLILSGVSLLTFGMTRLVVGPRARARPVVPSQQSSLQPPGVCGEAYSQTDRPAQAGSEGYARWDIVDPAKRVPRGPHTFRATLAINPEPAWTTTQHYRLMVTAEDPETGREIDSRDHGTLATDPGRRYRHPVTQDIDLPPGRYRINWYCFRADTDGQITDTRFVLRAWRTVTAY